MKSSLVGAFIIYNQKSGDISEEGCMGTGIVRKALFVIQDLAHSRMMEFMTKMNYENVHTFTRFATISPHPLLILLTFSFGCPVGTLSCTI